MNILLTGATGFVGRHLIPVLQREGHKLICVVRDEKKAIQILGKDNITYIISEHLSEVKNHNPECVIHLASHLSSKDDIDTLKTWVDTNILFGALLLDCLKQCDALKLFMNFGTFAQYRLGPTDINDAYLYSATKTAFEQLLKYYSDSGYFKYINIIPYTIYGGVDSQKKVIDYIKDSLDSQSPVKMSGGRQILDFIHVDDVVSFINYVISHLTLFREHPSVDYHLGTGKGTSIRELATMIEKKYKKKCNIEWGALPYRERDIMYAVAPIGVLLENKWRSSYILEEWV